MNGLVKTTLSTLQKRFQFSSRDMGFVVSSYDTGSTLCILPITYMFATGHKPLVIGLSLLILAGGTLIYSLPHFLTEPYAITDITWNDTDKCDTEPCIYSTANAPDETWVYGFFVVGQFLNGIGAASIRSIGSVYIDENLSQTGAPIAIGYFMAMGQAVGPAFGFIAGGALLEFWVDGSDRKPTEITSELWIGNWWLGFTVAGVCTVVVGLLIAGLPRELKDASAKQYRRVGQHKVDHIEGTHDEKKGTMKYALKSTMVILTNYTFMCIVFAAAFEDGMISSVTTYYSKFLEESFDIPASTSSMTIGVSFIIAAVCAQLIGGFWAGKANPTVKQQLMFCGFSVFMALLR